MAMTFDQKLQKLTGEQRDFLRKFIRRTSANHFEKYYANIKANDSEWVLEYVDDLGEMIGNCECGHAIRYEFHVRSLVTNKEMVLGSTCIATFMGIPEDQAKNLVNGFKEIRKEAEQILDTYERYKFDFQDYIEQTGLKSRIAKIEKYTNTTQNLTSDTCKKAERITDQYHEFWKVKLPLCWKLFHDIKLFCEEIAPETEADLIIAEMSEEGFEEEAKRFFKDHGKALNADSYYTYVSSVTSHYSLYENLLKQFSGRIHFQSWKSEDHREYAAKLLRTYYDERYIQALKPETLMRARNNLNARHLEIFEDLLQKANRYGLSWRQLNTLGRLVEKANEGSEDAKAS